VSLTITILGCGSSGGVPRIGGIWGACDPANPKNRRRRCAILIEKKGEGGVTTLLVDPGPDMRQQLLDAGVTRLDGVFVTHSHADHVHGIDDLRQVVFLMRERIKLWADGPTSKDLRIRFNYVFEKPEGSDYEPILDLRPVEDRVTVSGAGGDIDITPITVSHGRINSLGIRIDDFAYIPDVYDIPDDEKAKLHGLEMFVIDSLRYEPHPSHTHLARTLGWIEELAPTRAVLTNLHVDLDYETLAAETPDHVTPAFDGMQIELD